MAWLGLFTLMIFYWCLFTAVVTGRRSWAWLCILCLPVLIMSAGYQEGMQINGLIVLLCGFMFLVCRSSLKDILLWNQKKRKYHWILLGFLWFICFLFLFGKIFIVPIKKILKLVINSVLGGIAIFLINLIGGIWGFHIGLNVFTSILVGLLGLPGVVCLIIVKLLIG